MVKPEEVSEDQIVLLARDIAKKIEAELTYPSAACTMQAMTVCGSTSPWGASIAWMTCCSRIVIFHSTSSSIIP